MYPENVHQQRPGRTDKSRRMQQQQHTAEVRLIEPFELIQSEGKGALQLFAHAQQTLREDRHSDTGKLPQPQNVSRVSRDEFIWERR